MIKKLIIIVLFLCICTASYAQTWQSIPKRTQAQKTAGLSGGEGQQMILGIAYAPTDPNMVFFVTDTSQVWKSTDGGTSWQSKANGFGATGGTSVVFDPTNANIAYVSGMNENAGGWTTFADVVQGIFRTTDGGDNWTLVKSADFNRITRSDGVHIAFAGSNIYAAPMKTGILKSTNGTTWNFLLTSGGAKILDTLNLNSIAAHPTDNTILYVTASDGLYKIVDSNGSATVYSKNTTPSIGTGLPTGILHQIVVDHTTPSTIYICAKTNGVYKSTNSGTNFTKILASPVKNSVTGDARFIAISPANSSKLIVTFRNLFGNYVYHTSNGGTSWTQTTNMDESNASGWVAGSVFGYTSNISGVDNDYSPVCFHPTNQNTALAIGWGNQVKKTTDGGIPSDAFKYWKYSCTGYTGSGVGGQESSSAIGWDSTNYNRAVFSQGDWGSLLTEDNEDTFALKANVSHNDRYATPAAALYGNIIVQAVGSGNDGTSAAPIITISRNAGTSWTKIDNTLANYKLISFHPQNNNIVYAGKYKFTNIQNDNTYTTLSRVVAAIFNGNGNTVYSYSGSTIYKSTDAGVSWTTPYPSLNIPSGYSVSQIAVSPTDENRIYVSVRGKGVYIINNTTAGGGTAVLKNNAHGITLDQFGEINTGAIATDANNANVVYVGTRANWKGMTNGIFRSIDSGDTWTNISGNLGSMMGIKNISVRPDNSYVYISSFRGSWKLPPPGEDPGTPAGGSPLVTTGVATSVTRTTATLNGVVNPNNLQTTYSWQYGTSPATYTLATGSQTLSAGTSSTDVSIGITSLTGSTTYYTRIRAANGSGTTNGSETSFSTLALLSYSAPETTSVVVDGYLTEYGTFTAIEKIISGTPTATGSWSAYWTPGTSGGLYIGAAVIDASLYGDTGSSTPYNDDAIELYIDRDFNKSTSYDVYDRKFTNAYNSSFIHSKDTAGGTNTGVLSARAITAGGYNIEWFVPVANFSGGVAFMEGQTIGVDVQIDDDNDGGGREGSLSWNNISDNNYLSTANFGELTFVGTTTEGGGDPAMPIDTGSGTLSYLPNMVFLARLDEGTGSAYIVDATGNCPNGTITGATWVTGTSGAALQFDGTTYVNLGTPTALSFGGANQTFGLMFDAMIGTTTVPGTGIRAGISKYAASTYQWSLGNGNANVKGSKSWDGTAAGTNAPTGTSTLNITTWKNLSLSYDDIAVGVYVSGILENSTANTQGLYNGTASVRLGLGVQNLYGYIGKMDNVRVFNPYPTAQNITDCQKWPVVTTGTATPIYGTWATVYGTCTPYGTTTHAYVRYGTQSGSYTATTLETYIGTNSTAAGFSRTLGTLTTGTTYYYQSIAYNRTGNLVYGTEQTFVTTGSLDAATPVGTVTINSGATYNINPSVTLNLSATDDVGIEGYYISTGTTTPEIATEGWVSFGTVTPYSANIPYTFETGDGTRTVYAWYKDGVGNISNIASDFIIQDLTIPFIEITSPTYTCTYGDFLKRAKGTTSSTITLTGIASDLHDISSVSWANSATSTTGVFSGTATFSKTFNLVPAVANTFTLSALGNDGNTGEHVIVLGAIPEIESTVAATITISGALLKGTVSASNGTTTIWWNYGYDQDYYTGTTSTQELTGDTPTTVSVPLVNLHNMKTFYFRLGSTNSLGTTYSYESSFTLESPNSKGFLNW